MNSSRFSTLNILRIHGELQVRASWHEYPDSAVIKREPLHVSV